MKTLAALISMVLVHSSAVALLSVPEESVRGATIPKGRSRRATFVGVVDYRRAEPPIAIASDKTNKDRRTHYGNPTTSGGCMKDERPLKIEGVEGEICAPKCTAFQACPSDLPSGVAATPQCALKDPDARSAQMYCALIFNPSEDEKKNASSGEAAGSSLLRGAVPKDRSSSDSCDCGEASCQIVNGVGICTYLE